MALVFRISFKNFPYPIFRMKDSCSLNFLIFIILVSFNFTTFSFGPVKILGVLTSTSYLASQLMYN